MGDSMEDLKIYDREYLDNHSSVMEMLGQAEEKLTSYGSILADLRVEGVMLGKTAESIEDFGMTLVSSLSDILSSTGRVIKESMISYIDDIDSADQALY